jgi:rod shape-determining protein MreC
VPPFRSLVHSRPFVLLGIVALVWLLMPVALKRLLRVSFFELHAPMETAASRVRDLQEFWGLRLHPNRALVEAGVELARINAGYEIALQQAAGLRAEVRRLEDLLRLPPRPEYRYEIARVARRDSNTWWQRLVIRKGRDAGLIEGAPVVFSGGVVGRVVEVYAYTAVVDLVTSPTLRLTATFEGDSRPFTYQGAPNAPFGTPRGTVEFVPVDLVATAAAPVRIVTSGLGGVFPPGLTIGYVDRLEPSTDGLFKTGRVLLDARLNQLNEVAVLVPLRPD